ncbi:MAG: DUF1249 domain-containing protein [Xanthomonadales bacterium]|nr:DUF1249 domain-containing protein [Xanthomonadales bacterium]NIN75225.1 DUF1249 domain-containing protein [Xanthomonadales bacterium]NIO13467.1 DUF1249 domain-containing protein [Xanthomonadales bacterium]NIP75669.1 DUF1249 domain-containing protein [Xanthomonadales bacterium]NIQ35892.1 DUF1249 domain-containing protein [Xanthomonadales bacterium]
MVSFREQHGLRLKPRLRRLQRVQEEIFRQLQLLLPDAMAQHDAFFSRVNGSPLLRMDILERHPYTHFLRLTYQLETGEGQALAPDAHIRVYQDLRIAEVTAFNPEQGFRRSAHPWYPARQLLQRNWRQNIVLEKWLDYLLRQGHSMITMRPASDCIHEKHPLETPVMVG